MGEANRQPADVSAYLRRIRLLRKLLPLLALALLVIVGLAANPDIRRALSNKTQTDDRLVIAAPQFLGRLSDGRPYQMDALEGRQKSNGNIALKNADIVINAETPEARLHLSSKHADYFVQDGLATLTGNVTMRNAKGAVIDGARMVADFETGIMRASAVTMRDKAGRLQAEAMRADTQTRHYRFTKAVMRLQPAQP